MTSLVKYTGPYHPDAVLNMTEKERQKRKLDMAMDMCGKLHNELISRAHAAEEIKFYQGR